jgi:hypothetical protein
MTRLRAEFWLLAVSVLAFLAPASAQAETRFTV